MLRVASNWYSIEDDIEGTGKIKFLEE